MPKQASRAANPLPRPPANRFQLRTLFIVVSLLAVVLAMGGWYYRRFVLPLQQYRAIDQRLESLVARRPSDLSPRQWESAVAWTINLHGNSLLPFQADTAKIRHFEDRLDEKLAGDVDLQTILWIWDEYAAMCDGGQRYQRFKPIMLEEIEAGGADWSLGVR